MVRVPVDLADAVIVAAEVAGMTRSDYIADVLARHLERDEARGTADELAPDQDG
jgi:hypothetical protein